LRRGCFAQAEENSNESKSQNKEAHLPPPRTAAACIAFPTTWVVRLA
jgi:hypothetical protein